MHPEWNDTSPSWTGSHHTSTEASKPKSLRAYTDHYSKTEKPLSTSTKKLQTVSKAAQNSFTNHVVTLCHGTIFSSHLSYKLIAAFAGNSTERQNNAETDSYSSTIIILTGNAYCIPPIKTFICIFLREQVQNLHMENSIYVCNQLDVLTVVSMIACAFKQKWFMNFNLF